ncbi:hypothetical protein [Hydrocarboniphaga effusa]|jgi:hypothetical protein|uniref:hypothetical protein n=1 Tax=Hydrocarboniphaga effusa TaxID=243629 RepID=UPI003137E51B
MFVAEEEAAELVPKRLTIHLSKSDWEFLNSHLIDGKKIAIERSIAEMLAVEIRKLRKRNNRARGKSVAE